MSSIEERDLSNLENLLDDDQLKQIYDKCLEATTNGFIKWYRKASATCTKDKLEQKFSELYQSLENGFNKTFDELNEVKKIKKLINDIIQTCTELNITLPDVDFTASNASLVYLLEENLNTLKAFQKNRTLEPSTTQFKLESPTTHKRMTQNYEEFKAVLSERKNQRSTGLFWMEHGIPNIVIDFMHDSEESSVE